MLKHTLAFDEVENASLVEIKATLPEKDQLDMIARTFQALSDPTRCRLIIALTRHELRVSELAQIAETSVSAVSHHLKGLRDIRLVKFRREGNSVYYSIDDAHVGNLFREAISHLDHVQRSLPDHHVQ